MTLFVGKPITSVILVFFQSEVLVILHSFATGYSNQPQSISTSPILLILLVLAALSNLYRRQWLVGNEEKDEQQ
jgi:hypothetical protein